MEVNSARGAGFNYNRDNITSVPADSIKKTSKITKFSAKSSNNLAILNLLKLANFMEMFSKYFMILLIFWQYLAMPGRSFHQLLVSKYWQ